YEYARKNLLHGKIGTDYYFLDRLPELNRYYRYVPISQPPATPQLLEQVLADPEIHYLLFFDSAYPPKEPDWMLRRGLRTVFYEEGYRLVELPGNRPTQKKE